MNADRMKAGWLPENVYVVVLPSLAAIMVVAGWQYAVTAFQISPVIFPAPLDMAKASPGIIGDLFHHGGITGGEALLAFVLSCLIGVALALMLTVSDAVFEAFYPNLVVFQIVPKIALAPMFTFWLGIASTSRISYAILISFFPVMLSTMSGLKRADANTLRLCRSVGASKWQTLMHVQIPYALPYFFSGAKVAATMATIGVVTGELISANAGLGFYIIRAQSLGQTPKVFCAIVALCVLGLLVYILPVRAEAMARRWWRGGNG